MGVCCIILGKDHEGTVSAKNLERNLQKYAKPETMERMLKNFTETIQMEMISDVEYASPMETDYLSCTLLKSSKPTSNSIILVILQ